MQDLEGYLVSKGCQVRRSNNQLYTHCFFHGEEQGTKAGRLYFDDSSSETQGLYFCHVCSERGNITTLRRHFGDPPLDGGEIKASDSLRSLYLAAAQFYHESLTSEHRKYLQDRGLSDETISRFMLGSSNSGLGPHLRKLGFSEESLDQSKLFHRDGVEHLDGCITIPYLVGGSATTIRGRSMRGEGQKYFSLPGAPVALFNSESTWGAEEILVCEGEFNAIHLAQMGFAATATGGANSWKDAWTGYFTDKDSFVLFDPDEAGAKGALRVKEKLGPACRIIELDPPHDINDLVVDAQWTLADFTALLDENRWANSILVSPLDALKAHQTIATAGGLQTGFENLDELLAPGLLPGQLMIPLAPTNNGKSLLLYNMMHRAAMLQPDKKFLLISLEQTAADWMERAQRIYNFYDIDCDPSKVQEKTVEYWTDRAYLIEKNRVTLEELKISVDEFERRVGSPPDLIFVDYLGYWARGFKNASSGNSYERTTEAVMALKAAAKHFGIPIVAPHQVNRGVEHGKPFSIDHAREAGTVEETGDFVMPFWDPDLAINQDEDNPAEEKVEPKGMLVMNIGKSRHGGKGENVYFVRGKYSLTMLPVKLLQGGVRAYNSVEYEQLRRIETELRLSQTNQMYTWQEIMEGHRRGATPDLTIGDGSVGYIGS